MVNKSAVTYYVRFRHGAVFSCSLSPHAFFEAKVAAYAVQVALVVDCGFPPSSEAYASSLADNPSITQADGNDNLC